MLRFHASLRCFVVIAGAAVAPVLSPVAGQADQAPVVVPLPSAGTQPTADRPTLSPHQKSDQVANAGLRTLADYGGNGSTSTPPSVARRLAHLDERMLAMPSPSTSLLIVLAAAGGGALVLWLIHLAGLLRLFRSDDRWPQRRA